MSKMIRDIQILVDETPNKAGRRQLVECLLTVDSSKFTILARKDLPVIEPETEGETVKYYKTENDGMSRYNIFVEHMRAPSYLTEDEYNRVHALLADA